MEEDEGIARSKGCHKLTRTHAQQNTHTQRQADLTRDKGGTGSGETAPRPQVDRR